jgi:amino acid transporter
MGPFGAALLGVAVVLSTFGYLCGMILAIPRALFAFARDGILPNALAAVHQKYRTPWIAIIVQAVLSLTLALSSGFEPLVILANVSVLFVYLGCAAAAWQLRRRGISDEGPGIVKPIPGSRFAPALAVLVIVVLLTSIAPREWMVAGSCAGVGVVIWLFSAGPAGRFRTRRRAMRAGDAPASPRRSRAENETAEEARRRT